MSVRRFILTTVLVTLGMCFPASVHVDEGGVERLSNTAQAGAAAKKKRREERAKRNAKRRKKKGLKVAPAPVPVPKPLEAQLVKPSPQKAPPPPPPPKESVEADVSTRTISVTTAFQGTEIVVFGSINNSRQTSAEAGYYDVIVVLEGQKAPLVVRRKSNVAGLWVNTAATAFDAVPSYYATASTRPMEEIADPDLLRENVIGYRNLRFTARAKMLRTMLASEVQKYRDAVTRLKEDEGLFLREDYGVAFIGRSLFRTSIELPANIPVGRLQARVYLFHEGKMLSRYSTRVNLQRSGFELWIYDFAQDYAVLYGSLTVLLALGCGLAASAVFRRAG